MTADVAGLAGLALIVWAIISLDHQTPYPGFWALVPTLGAMLVIWSGKAGSSLVGRLLSLRPLVFTGLVSYAWYLWHWPAIVFFRYEFGREPEGLEVAALIAISLALAALCWAYIEKPIRRGQWWSDGRRAVRVGLATTLSLIALAGTGYATDGYINRFPAAVQELARDKLRHRMDGRCAKTSADTVARDELCNVWNANNDVPGVLLWGDSHARVLAPIFGDIAQTIDVPLVFAGQAACPPLIGVGRRRGSSHSRESCSELNLAVGELLQRRKFTDVVLAARWNYYLGGLNADDIPWVEQHYFESAHVEGGTLAQNRLVFAEGFKRTIELIAASGARVWIVSEVPYAGLDVPLHVARNLIKGISQQTLFGINLKMRGERRI